MKMEEHFKDTLERAVANEPPVIDSWTTFERRVRRDRGVRMFGSAFAIVAVIVAAVIVVPKLGRNPAIITPSTNPPSPNTDPYAGWKTYEYDLYDFKLRYPEDWSIKIFESDPEVVAPGQKATAAGEVTMAVTLTLLDARFYDPQWREFGLDPGTRPDGRTFVRHITEPLDGGGRRIEYSIDWSTCLRSAEPPTCVRMERTLFVAIHVGTEALGVQYGTIAEKIVTSIEYV